MDNGLRLCLESAHEYVSRSMALDECMPRELLRKRLFRLWLFCYALQFSICTLVMNVLSYLNKHVYEKYCNQSIRPLVIRLDFNLMFNILYYNKIIYLFQIHI